MDDLINSILLELDELAKENVRKFPFKRYLYPSLVCHTSKVFKAILGPRGVGKTTLIQQLSVENPHSFYFSADTIDTDIDLFELVKILNSKYNYRSFFIDEIHVNKNYAKSLKNIYDFLDIRLIFTSSMAISLVDTAYDLSRRVSVRELHIFPYWEYLNLKGIQVEPISLDSILTGDWSKELNRNARYFEEYLKKGCLPYFLEGADTVEGQRNILNKVIEKDIPAVYAATSDDIFQMKKVVKFVAQSSPDGVSYSSLSNNLGITKYKAQQYVECLSKAYILNVSTPHGTNVSKEPKILMYLPNRLIFNSFEDSLGGLREDFATSMLRYLAINYSYLKTNRGKKTPDFYFQINKQRIVCEVGGKNKGHQQFKDLKNYDHKLIFKHGNDLKKNDLPLFLLGLVGCPLVS